MVRKPLSRRRVLIKIMTSTTIRNRPKRTIFVSDGLGRLQNAYASQNREEESKKSRARKLMLFIRIGMEAI